MKKRLFKYRIIGVLIFLIELFIFALFSYGSYDSFIEVNSEDIFSQQNSVFSLALIISITAFLSLIFILFRIRKSILLLNIHYSIILLFFIYAFVESIFENDLPHEDILKFVAIFSIIFVILFIINFFKYKKVIFFEIDNIGTHND